MITNYQLLIWEAITKKIYELQEAYLRLLAHGSKYDKDRSLSYKRDHVNNENNDLFLVY